MKEKDELKKKLKKHREDSLKKSLKGGFRNDPVSALSRRVRQLEDRVERLEELANKVNVRTMRF